MAYPFLYPYMLNFSLNDLPALALAYSGLLITPYELLVLAELTYIF